MHSTQEIDVVVKADVRQLPRFETLARQVRLSSPGVYKVPIKLCTNNPNQTPTELQLILLSPLQGISLAKECVTLREGKAKAVLIQVREP